VSAVAADSVSVSVVSVDSVSVSAAATISVFSSEMSLELEAQADNKIAVDKIDNINNFLHFIIFSLHSSDYSNTFFCSFKQTKKITHRKTPMG
jgi:hypothetical protein